MKTYTISEDLYKAIIESVYHKGRVSTQLIKHPHPQLRNDYQEKAVLEQAIKVVEDQQYIYED